MRRTNPPEAKPVEIRVVTSYGGDDGNRANYEEAVAGYEAATGNTVAVSYTHLGQWSAAQHGCQRAAPGPEQRETKQRGQHNCRKPRGGGRHHPVRFHRIPPECIEFRAFCD